MIVRDRAVLYDLLYPVFALLAINLRGLIFSFLFADNRRIRQCTERRDQRFIQTHAAQRLAENVNERLFLRFTDRCFRQRRVLFCNRIDQGAADACRHMKSLGKPATLVPFDGDRLMLAAVLTGTNPLTNRPLTVNTLKNILTGEGYTNEDDGTDEDDDYTPILRFKD